MAPIKGFTILEGDEIPFCIHKWEYEYRWVPVNPNGEYVQGYGHTPVFTHELIGKRCVKCGFIESENGHG